MLTASNVLLRGQKLMNTPYVFGLVVYTGHETKIMKNNEREVARKVTLVEREMNKQLIYVFIGLFTFCVGAAIGSAHFVDEFSDTAWYLGLQPQYSSSYSTNWYGTVDVYLVAILSFLTFLMLFSNMVPISLYVTTGSICFLNV